RIFPGIAGHTAGLLGSQYTIALLQEAVTSDTPQRDDHWARRSRGGFFQVQRTPTCDDRCRELDCAKIRTQQGFQEKQVSAFLARLSPRTYVRSRRCVTWVTDPVCGFDG